MLEKQSLAEGVYCNHSTPRGRLLRRGSPGNIAREEQKQSELESKLEQGQGTKNTGGPSGTCVGRREATCSLLHRVSEPCMSLGSTRKLVWSASTTFSLALINNCPDHLKRKGFILMSGTVCHGNEDITVGAWDSQSDCLCSWDVQMAVQLDFSFSPSPGPTQRTELHTAPQLPRLIHLN